MKVKRSDRPHESSLTSIEMLTSQIETYFKTRPDLKSKNRFYPENPSSIFPAQAEEVDIIVFGNAFKSMMNSGLWPAKKIRLWCLSARFKTFLSELFSDIEVNLINRADLFTPSQNKRAVTWQEPMDLVYAGRISAQKNIESLIWTNYFLQQSNPNCRLHLVGDFDGHYHEHLGRREVENYEEKIRSLISSLEWTTPPRFHPKMGKNEWYKLSFKNPIAISLSTYLCEDFGVSLAQAAQEGWPIICSNFGGHADIRDVNIVFADNIPHSHLPSVVIKLMSSLLVKDLLSKSFEFFEYRQSSQSSFPFFAIENLDQQRRQLANRLGVSATLIALDELSEFADSTHGACLIQEIETTLQAKAKTSSIILYDCDQEHLAPSDEKELEAILKEIPRENRIQFISSKNIFFKDQLMKIMNSQSIYLVLEPELKKKTQAALSERLGLKITN